MTLPLPPDDPRQVRALEAFAAQVHVEALGLADGLGDKGVAYREGIIARSGRELAAYFSALQTEGVRLVAAPPCKACEGTGKIEWNDVKGHKVHGNPVCCPRCNGSGLARMVALDDVEADIERAAVLLGCFATGAGRDDVRREAHLVSDRLSAALRRFSGTGEETKP